MTNNKIAKGIVSLTIIVVLLLSVLAGSFYYQNNITANAVKEASADFDKNILIKEIDAKNLNQLNQKKFFRRKTYPAKKTNLNLLNLTSKKRKKREKKSKN